MTLIGAVILDFDLHLVAGGEAVRKSETLLQDKIDGPHDELHNRKQRGGLVAREVLRSIVM